MADVVVLKIQSQNHGGGSKPSSERLITPKEQAKAFSQAIEHTRGLLIRGWIPDARSFSVIECWRMVNP